MNAKIERGEGRKRESRCTRAVLMLLLYVIIIYMLISMITLFMLQKLRLGINPILLADCCYTGVVAAVLGLKRQPS